MSEDRYLITPLQLTFENPMFIYSSPMDLRGRTTRLPPFVLPPPLPTGEFRQTTAWHLQGMVA